MSKEIPLTNSDAIVLVDEDIYERFSKFKWHLSAQGYANRSVYISETKKTVQSAMHREITAARSGEQIDHADGNKLNNTRQNLRFCDNSKNLCNSRKRQNCISRYKGVSFDKRRNHWKAEIQYQNKRYNVGIFDDEVIAARARDGAAIYYHKEFASLNFSPELAISYQPSPPKSKYSKYKGVSYAIRAGRWQAKIQINNVQHYLGLFDTEEEAHQARLVAEDRTRA